MSNHQPPWYKSELDIAELLWCAAHLNRIISIPTEVAQQPQASDTPPSQLSTGNGGSEMPTSMVETKKTEDRVKVYPKPRNAIKPQIRTSSPIRTQTFSPVRLPDIFALPDPFETGKALLPFGRRVAGGRQWEININETVEQTASANGLPMIVLQPELERWFDLQILVDNSPSMEFWGDLADTFKSIFEWQGLFKDIRVWNFDTRQRQQTVLSSGTARSPRELRSLIVPSQDRLFVVLTDTLGNAWQSGQAFEDLAQLGQVHSVSIAHIFPSRLWLRTALNQAFFRALLPGSANQPNRILEYKTESPAQRDIHRFPIFNINAKHLKTWAKFITGQSTTHQGVMASRTLFNLESSSQQVTEASPEEQLNDFYFDASDLAQYLLEVLAAIPLIPPVMRIAQQRYLPESDHSHLAEIIFSGLLRKSTFSQRGNRTDDLWYEFQPKIRELVLSRTSIKDASEVHQAISDFVEQHYGSPKDFQAFIPNEQGTTQRPISYQVAYFAEVRATLLIAWGGAFAQQGKKMLQEVEQKRQQIVQNETSKVDLSSPPFPSLQTLSFVSAYLADLDLPDSYFPPELYTEEYSVSTISFHTSEEPESETPSLSYTTARISRRDKDWEIERKVIQIPQSDYFLENLFETVSLTLMRIPAGNFMMGSPDNEVDRYSFESTRHHVSMSQSFWLGQTPITKAQWRFACTLQTKRQPLIAPAESQEDDHPIVRVSWLEAVEFCDRLSAYTGCPYRLPTEAEWEYACRAGTTTPFHFGETLSPIIANYRSESSYNKGPTGNRSGGTTPVGQYDAANQWGLSDMHGNVWEWCQDNWHSNYKGAPKDGSAWGNQDDEYHVVRGGSWNDDPRDCRSASRVSVAVNVGFRVACSKLRT